MDKLSNKCSLCGETHPIPSEYPSLSMEDLCPTLIELNSSIHSECVSPTYEHPYWADPIKGEEEAKVTELKSYADYLLRKAYSGVGLSSREQFHLEVRMKEMPKSSLGILSGISRNKKKRRQDSKDRYQRSSPRHRYRYYRNVWKWKGWKVNLTEDEYVKIYEESFIVPVGTYRPWVGTLAEYIRSKEEGGLGLVHVMARVDSSKPFQLGNLVFKEQIPFLGERELLRC